jgi:hypothetical protein
MMHRVWHPLTLRSVWKNEMMLLVAPLLAVAAIFTVAKYWVV